MSILQRYFDENFFLIPIRKNDKRPVYRKWTDNSISYNEAKQYTKHGYNLGVVSGKQSIKEGYELIIVDVDDRPKPFDLEYFRSFNTWIQFTPGGGFHIFLRVKPYENLSKTKEFIAKHNLTPHRTTIEPKHEDITWKQPDKEEHKQFFADTIRWTSMYALVNPSKVDGKAYWWLDDCKGEMLRL